MAWRLKKTHSVRKRRPGSEICTLSVLNTKSHSSLFGSGTVREAYVTILPFVRFRMTLKGDFLPLVVTLMHCTSPSSIIASTSAPSFRISFRWTRLLLVAILSSRSITRVKSCPRGTAYKARVKPDGRPSAAKRSAVPSHCWLASNARRFSRCVKLESALDFGRSGNARFSENLLSSGLSTRITASLAEGRIPHESPKLRRKLPAKSFCPSGLKCAVCGRRPLISLRSDTAVPGRGLSTSREELAVSGRSTKSRYLFIMQWLICYEH